ncbi:6424_t:CDS:2, partial [Cetraspora pellucida]
MSKFLRHNKLEVYCCQDRSIISEDFRIINIQVQQWLTNSEIQSSQLTSYFDNNTALKDGLFAAYNKYMGQHDNGEFYACIKLHIGNIVLIKEDDDESYAI